MDEDVEAAGWLLQHLRGLNGISQERLARDTGIAVRTIRRIEHGKVADLPTYDALGRAFGLPRTWFLTAARLLAPVAAARTGNGSLVETLEELTASGRLRSGSARLIAALVELSVHDPDAANRMATGFQLQLDDRLARSSIRST